MRIRRDHSVLHVVIHKLVQLEGMCTSAHGHLGTRQEWRSATRQSLAGPRRGLCGSYHFHVLVPGPPICCVALDLPVT